jgi:hypothetical protein
MLIDGYTVTALGAVRTVSLIVTNSSERGAAAGSD